MEQSIKRLSLAGIAVVLAGAFSIGLSNIVVLLLYEAGSNTVTLMMIRFFGFLLVFGAWFWLRGVSLALSRRDRVMALMGGVWFTFGGGFLLLSFAHLPVALAILIFYIHPLLTLFGDCLLDRRLPSLLALAGLAGVLIGLALALNIEFSQINPFGIFYAILAAIGVSVAYLWTEHKLAGVNAAVLTFHMSLTGLVIMGGLCLTTDSWMLTFSTPDDWILLVAAMALFCLFFFLIFRGIKLVGAVPSAMMMNMEPVFTIGFAFVILGDSLSPPQLAGAALVVSSIIIAQLGGRPAVNSLKGL